MRNGPDSSVGDPWPLSTVTAFSPVSRWVSREQGWNQSGENERRRAEENKHPAFPVGRQVGFAFLYLKNELSKPDNKAQKPGSDEAN